MLKGRESSILFVRYHRSFPVTNDAVELTYSLALEQEVRPPYFPWKIVRTKIVLSLVHRSQCLDYF